MFEFVRGQSMFKAAMQWIRSGSPPGEMGMGFSETTLRSVELLVREASPVQVILFGSYARGDAGPDSDLDWLVVERELPRRQTETARLRQVLSPLRFRVDLFVIDRQQLPSSCADFPGFWLYHALREGKVLFELDGACTPASA